MDALSGARREELRSLLVLDGLPGVGPATVLALVGRFGSARRALASHARDFAGIAGERAAALRRESERWRTADALLARAEARGMATVLWTDPAYPPMLRRLADPPPVLFLRGRGELLGGAGIAVVGSRRATRRARDLAERLGAALAAAGRPVVSGLALGVDGAAHAGALAAGGDTVAVLGSGPDVAYPRAHARLFRRIVDEGLVVSEFPPGTPPLPHHFPRRNRVLAALATATVVVEAGERSGALITVDHALDLGHDVWVVPGPIEREACVGSNALLAEGARPLLSVEHFVGALPGARGAAGPVGSVGSAGASGAAPAGARGAAPAAPSVAGPRDRVLAAVGLEPRTCDEIAARSGLPVPTVAAHLTALELGGRVKRLAGMRYRSAA